MVKFSNRILLDCTLRDGGYVNNWEFGAKTALQIRDALYDSGIHYIELGIMGRDSTAGRQTKFASFDEVQPLLEGRRPGCQYCVMITQAELSNAWLEIPPRSKTAVDIIRLAYFKPEKSSALISAHKLKEKGYEVFLQAMATFMYTKDELSTMIKEINCLQPAAFYIVDSFSTMYNEDVQMMAEFSLENLADNIYLGFHAHNNIQMAFSNAITFINMQTDRRLMIDGSIFGMGRGAGNVPLELLMEYINKKLQGNYTISAILSVFESCIKPIFREYYWGYSMPYLLTASKGINSAYAWYFGRKGIVQLADLEGVLCQIPDEYKYTLVKSAADNSIANYWKEKWREQGDNGTA